MIKNADPASRTGLCRGGILPDERIADHQPFSQAAGRAAPDASAPSRILPSKRGLSASAAIPSLAKTAVGASASSRPFVALPESTNLPTGGPQSPDTFIDLLQTAVKLFSDWCDGKHQGFCDNLISGLLLALLLSFAALAWWLANDQIWRGLAWLGGQPGFQRLALSAYRREVAAHYGVLRNIYLGTIEQLALRDVFVPLTLHGAVILHPQRLQQTGTARLRCRANRCG